MPASFFWQTVTTNRSLAFGGNSRREFFPSAAACTDFINDVEGPESCNSYNMLKLTEDLFRKNPFGQIHGLLRTHGVQSYPFNPKP